MRTGACTLVFFASTRRVADTPILVFCVLVYHLSGSLLFCLHHFWTTATRAHDATPLRDGTNDRRATPDHQITASRETSGGTFQLLADLAPNLGVLVPGLIPKAQAFPGTSPAFTRRDQTTNHPSCCRDGAASPVVLFAAFGRPYLPVLSPTTTGLVTKAFIVKL